MPGMMMSTSMTSGSIAVAEYLQGGFGRLSQARRRSRLLRISAAYMSRRNLSSSTMTMIFLVEFRHVLIGVHISVID